MAAEATILIANYRTPQITVLCLRLLRKFTDLSQARVIVIDNNSNDQSVEYLRSVRWIHLIERVPETHESGPLSHARALDEGLVWVDTPYTVVLHTDTFVKRSDWITALLQPMKIDANVAGVGSWKLETRSLMGNIGRRTKEYLQRYLSRGDAGCSTATRYLRSHCASYRTELLTRHDLKFAENGNRWPAGKVLHDKLLALGYSTTFVPAEILSAYVTHLEHATMVLNPDLGASRRTIMKGVARMRRVFDELDADRLLSDPSLDA